MVTGLQKMWSHHASSYLNFSCAQPSLAVFTNAVGCTPACAANIPSSSGAGEWIELWNLAICPLVGNMVGLDVNAVLNCAANNGMMIGVDSLHWIIPASISSLKGKRTYTVFCIIPISFRLICVFHSSIYEAFRVTILYEQSSFSVVSSVHIFCRPINRITHYVRGLLQRHKAMKMNAQLLFCGLIIVQPGPADLLRTHLSMLSYGLFFFLV